MVAQNESIRSRNRALTSLAGRGTKTKEQLADQVKSTLRQEEAFRLKREGYSFPQMAAELGISHQSAKALFYRALDARTVPPEEVEEYRRLEVERLEALRSAVWEDALDGQDDKIQTALRIHDRLARLLGLNAPEKVELNVTIKAQIMSAMVHRLDQAMSEAGIPVEQQQLVAATLLQGALALPGSNGEEAK